MPIVRSQTLINYGFFECVKEGVTHSVLEVHDLTPDGWSETAFKLGWLNIKTVSGDAVSCPQCYSDAWKARTGDGMGR